MDSLVFKKFDLKKTQALKEIDDAVLSTKNQYAAKGVLNSGMYVSAIYKITSNSITGLIDVLLQTYKDVGEETGEDDFVIKKENEITAEVQSIASWGGEYVQNYLKNQLQQNGAQAFPTEANSFWSNLVSEARTKAEILIETNKRRLQNKQAKQAWTKEVFVVMQIGDPELDKIWQDVYVPVITDFKMDPRRIDKHNEGRFLMSEIANLLNRSCLIIADLTNERPNCYLEVGYALGIEKYNRLILCAREDHHPESPNFRKGGPKVHFDINGYDILFWDPAKIDDFKIGLAKKIQYRLAIQAKNGGVS